MFERDGRENILLANCIAVVTADSESNVSGLMSRQQSVKRSVRRRGKGSLSLAAQHETLIGKLQEQLAELKNTMQADI